MTGGGRALGLVLLFVVLVGPLAAAGVIALTRGRKEIAEQAAAANQRKILDMVKTRGQVNISDVIIELQSDMPTVQDMIYRLVGMGVFSGYINWDEGTLYSAKPALREPELPELRRGAVARGQRRIKCPYCERSIFYPSAGRIEGGLFDGGFLQNHGAARLTRQNRSQDPRFQGLSREGRSACG